MPRYASATSFILKGITQDTSSGWDFLSPETTTWIIGLLPATTMTLRDPRLISAFTIGSANLRPIGLGVKHGVLLVACSLILGCVSKEML